MAKLDLSCLRSWVASFGLLAGTGVVGCASSTGDGSVTADDVAVAADGAVEVDPTDEGPSPTDVGVDSRVSADTAVDTAVATDTAASPDTTATVDSAAADTTPTVDTAVDPTAPKSPMLIVSKISGATPAELTMIADGVTLANATMKTTCFKDFVLKASWTETKGLTQAQIWTKLSSGPVTIDVEMFMGTWYQNNVSRTIGYEVDAGTVHMNRYFIKTAYAVASNLIHEAEGHSQGFSHFGTKSTSVPYGLNDAFESCAPKP